jgi:hypothetical protein
MLTEYCFIPTQLISESNQTDGTVHTHVLDLLPCEHTHYSAEPVDSVHGDPEVLLDEQVVEVGIDVPPSILTLLCFKDGVHEGNVVPVPHAPQSPQSCYDCLDLINRHDRIYTGRVSLPSISTKMPLVRIS